MIEWTEMAARLGTATLAGALLGLDRDLHHKPIGVRTLGLVGKRLPPSGRSAL